MNAIPLPDDFGLRPLRADDAPDIFTGHRHAARTPRALAPVRGRDAPRGTDPRSGRRHAGRPGQPVFTLRVGDAFAGLIGFKSADSTTLTIEIGYWLRSEYQGRGLMTAAAEALCRMAFGQMGMENVEIKCAAATCGATGSRCASASGSTASKYAAEQLADGEFTDLNVYRLPRP